MSDPGASLGLSIGGIEVETIPVRTHTAEFVKGCKFWCNECDGCLVDSDNPETGRFFSVHGHEWIPECKQNDRQKFPDGAGSYTQVIFAMCKGCLGY